MNEERLRQIVAQRLGLQPDDLTDETNSETCSALDSHGSMEVMLAVEEEWDRQFNDDEIGMLTSWPAIRDIVLGTPHFLKALVLDADGVLWAGVIGEGRIVPFPNAQETYLALKKRGVLLCLATRNNQADVDAAFAFEGMVLRQEDFAVLECGWHNKTESLQRIAETLNIGLDSLVFVDDSQFECEAVRQQLPEVTVLHCPTKLALGVAREAAALFPTMVDTSKTEEYRARGAAEATRPAFATEAEFLASLDIKVGLRKNRRVDSARVAELCQKANQFNLTTKRHTLADIRAFMDDPQTDVYSVTYKDRFGDQGITGVVIIGDGNVDTFLLSCRILGRGVEDEVWGQISDSSEGGMFTASYVPTPKNMQVRNLWDRLGMNLLREEPNGTRLYVG